MSESDERSEAILQAVRGWARSTKSDNFQKFYLFGSLISSNGEYFATEGGFESDVDVLVQFSDKCSNSVMRYKAIIALKEQISSLEEEISSINSNFSVNRSEKRSTPWLSVIPMTEYEIYHAIHKGHDPELLCSSQFNDLENDNMEFGALTDYIDFRFHQLNLERITAIKVIQKIRNLYLKPNFLSAFRSTNYAFPKEFLRTGALLKYAETKNKELRTDLDTGQQFLSNMIVDAVDLFKNSEHREVLENISDIVKTRSSTIRSSKELSPEHLLLISEILFARCVIDTPATLREAIDAITMKYTV